MKKQKTHCKRGHEFTPENTYIVFEGKYKKRKCKSCQLQRLRKFQNYTGKGNPKKEQTHCKRGHEFTPENTYIQVQNGLPTRKCETCRSQSQVEYVEKNREYVNQRQLKRWNSYDEETKQRYYKKGKDHRQEIKLEVISHYSPNLNCTCCGETQWNFLTIDHIHNNGNLHKKQNNNLKGGSPMYNWIKKHNFPKGFQILCMNCNFGKRMNNGICPHKEEKKTIPITVEWNQ